MTDRVEPIPEGRAGAIPYICVDDAAGAIAFYGRAFGALEILRFTDPGGKIGHAEIEIGPACLMLADAYPDHGFKSPKSYGGSPVSIHLFVEDVDAMMARAVAAGASVLRPAEDQFYGDRSGKLEDPFGHVWLLSTRRESLSIEEMQSRFTALMAGGAS
jgi:PhnB protein